jgi:hypothetical protein
LRGETHNHIPPAAQLEAQSQIDKGGFPAGEILARALRQLRIKGKGPRFIKVDGRLLVSATELRRWLTRQA